MQILHMIVCFFVLFYSTLGIFYSRESTECRESLKQEGTRKGTQGGKRGACSGSRPDRSIISRAMLPWVATESARNRAFRHKERGAPVRSAWRSE
jgi:hypothetical protein